MSKKKKIKKLKEENAQLYCDIRILIKGSEAAVAMVKMRHQLREDFERALWLGELSPSQK